MTVLAVAVGLLAVLTLLNLFVLLGVVRRLRTMAASAGEEVPEELPAIGAPVGEFRVTSTTGAVLTAADVSSGRSVVLLLSPSCTPCQGTASKLAKNRDELPERLFVLLNSEPGDPDLPAMLVTLDGVATIAVYDGTAGVEDAFGSSGYPTAVRIEDGIIAAASYKYADVLPDRVPA